MPEHSSILVLGCDPEMKAVLREFFEKGGGRVLEAPSLSEAFLSSHNMEHCDLVCLDIDDEAGESLNLITEARKAHPQLPILVMVNPEQERLEQEALWRGANRVIKSSADPLRVLSWMREALLEQKRASKENKIIDQVSLLLNELQKIDGIGKDDPYFDSPMEEEAGRFLRAGPFVLDLDAQRVQFSEKVISLPSIGFDYFVTLARHAPHAVSYEILVKESHITSLNTEETRRMARWRIHQLRKLLEPDPDNPIYILTIRSFGYRLVT